jgi:hypothetical protein
MSLVHGREILAEEIERIVGRQFSVHRFVSLCNATAWAVSQPAGIAQVFFSERIYVADNGIDAELVIDIPAFAPPNGAMLVPGRVVLQYKQRDVTARERNRLIGELERNLDRAAQNVRRRTGAPVDQYILFTNIDLARTENQRLSDAIGVDANDINIRVYGASELAPVLNNLPHLRSAYFVTAHFASWSKSWENHSRATLAANAAPFLGRANIVAAARAAVDDPDVKVLIFVGPPDIGKSRLALEATRHRPFETVVAINRGSLAVPDLLALTSPRQHPIIIVDEPDQTTGEAIASTALSEQLKLLITVSSPEIFNAINYGRDNRVQMFTLGPLTDEESQGLLRATGLRLDYNISTWICECAGGNPGVLLAAAHVGGQLRIQVPNFSSQVGQALQTRAREALGAEGLRRLGFLSVLTAVGFSGDVQGELDCITGILGSDDARIIVDQARTMAASGFLRITGSYLEVTPPIFANNLAETTLSRRPQDVAELFVALSSAARVRLLRRISRVPSNVLRGFWDSLFQTGPLSSFEGALAQVSLLRLVAPAMPARVGQLVLDGLSQLSLEQRRGVDGNVRRELVWTIDQLLFRAESARAALRSLALLAEAENEDWANNAAGVFSECFHPWHPQLPLSVDDRFDVLREFLSGGMTQSRKLLALKVGETAFSRTGSFTLRRAEGGLPLDAVPPMTHAQIRQYLCRIIDLVRDLMGDPDDQVSQRAGQVLITAVGEYTIQADPAQGTRLLEGLRDQVVEGTVPIRLDIYVATLEYAAKGIPPEEQFADARDRLRVVLESLDDADFSVRLRRWVGSWNLGYRMEVEGQQVYRGELEIRQLAESAAANPGVVSAASLEWLNSTGAKRSYEFFYAVGRNDDAALWQEIIERAGRSENGVRAFAAYFGGRAVRFNADVERRLDDLVLDDRIDGRALVAATGVLPGSGGAVRRVVTLINRGSVAPEFVERNLIAGGWINPLSEEETVDLLAAIGGIELERASLVVDFLAMWVHTNKPFDDRLRELAWSVLERAPTSGEAWDFDILAAAIVSSDYGRGLRLLERYLTVPYEQRSWEPLDRHGGNTFWKLLWQFDSRRCIEALREIGNASPTAAWRIRWHLPEILDLVTDHDIFIECARESAANAELIASWLASKEGFWTLAVEILSMHPDNERIRTSIVMSAEHMNRTVWGESSANYAAWAVEIEVVLADARTPNVTRAFLRDLANSFRRRSEDELRSEQEGRVNS